MWVPVMRRSADGGWDVGGTVYCCGVCEKGTYLIEVRWESGDKRAGVEGKVELVVDEGGD
jgi:hypothetical protein